MKNLKIIFLCLLTLIVGSCDLEEVNPNLASENAFETTQDAQATLNGVYSAMTEANYFGVQYFYLVNLSSGMAVTKKGGAKNNGSENSTTCSLKPTSNNLANEFTWSQGYTIIARANNVINSAVEVENPTTPDERAINDVIGQAYFIRAYIYLNKVRLWGDIPLRVDLISSETVHLAKSSEKEIYTQIISDAQNAASLMNGSMGLGYPKKYAANMLLSKLYMTLATAPESLKEKTSAEYWQLAYDEAKKVYGQYELVDEYISLFTAADGSNTEESIFEIQSSLGGASLDLVRSFTPSNFTKAKTFGRLLANAEVYDLHYDTYPDDPRFDATYITTFTQPLKNNKLFQTYPDHSKTKNRTRNKLKFKDFLTGFPMVHKLGSKNQENTSLEGDQNFIVYRYADLLLMLSEISNELSNGEQMGYVTEVLDRVGIAPQSGYTGGQESFRSAIMKEYQFELLLEGQDWFTNRRRGFDYFTTNIIEPHNNYSKFNGEVDVTFATDEATVMRIPFPEAEINGNEEISN